MKRRLKDKYWPLVASAAMAEVMRGLWGDATNVAAQNMADIDYDNDGFAPRTFASLTDSMNETAVSRICARIHYQSAVYESIDQDRCVADHVNALPWRK